MILASESHILIFFCMHYVRLMLIRLRVLWLVTVYNWMSCLQRRSGCMDYGMSGAINPKIQVITNMQLRILRNCYKESNVCNQADNFWLHPSFLILFLILLIRLQTVVLSTPSRRAISL